MTLERSLKIGFILLGIGFLIAASSSYSHTQQFQNDSLTAVGNITGFVKIDRVGNRSNHHNNARNKLVIVFTTESGHSAQFISKTSFYSNEYSEGQNVEVIYDKYDYFNAKLLKYYDNRGYAPQFAGLGLTSVFIGFLFMLFLKDTDS